MNKKIRIAAGMLLAVICCALCFSGCGGKMTLEKLEKLPADYTVKQAEKDGMIIVNSEINEKEISQINEFFENYNPNSASEETRYLYLCDENCDVTVFIAYDKYVARIVYSIKKQYQTEGFNYYSRYGIREHEDGTKELYLYSEETDQEEAAFKLTYLEKSVYFYK